MALFTPLNHPGFSSKRLHLHTPHSATEIIISAYLSTHHWSQMPYYTYMQVACSGNNVWSMHSTHQQKKFREIILHLIMMTTLECTHTHTYPYTPTYTHTNNHINPLNMLGLRCNVDSHPYGCMQLARISWIRAVFKCLNYLSRSVSIFCILQCATRICLYILWWLCQNVVINCCTIWTFYIFNGGVITGRGILWLSVIDVTFGSIE